MIYFYICICVYVLLGWLRCLRFNNMLYMKVIELSATLGQELPYIVGLQSELPFGKRDLAQLAKNTKVCGRGRSKKISVINFWVPV